MRIVTIANADLQKEVELKLVQSAVEVLYASSIQDLPDYADAYFYLKPERELAQDLHKLSQLSGPIFVNAVSIVLSELPANFIRLNGWSDFVGKEQLEIVFSKQNSHIVERIMNALNWKYSLVPDIPGMITPRVIAMIINEAYFALEDGVSTKENIDIAMKLGTNYPFGPFEWSEKIGVENIVALLNTLAEVDPKYAPAPFLTKMIS